MNAFGHLNRQVDTSAARQMERDDEWGGIEPGTMDPAVRDIWRGIKAYQTVI
jgi:hypothetical protein